MAIRHIKALYRIVAALALFSIGANQQVHAIGLTSQPATTGNKVHLAAAALSGPVSMAAIAYPDSKFLGCAEHVLKAIDEFMAMAQYREFHPSLIGWFCYDVYHAFASLQGPAIEPVGDADLANQLATFEADNTDTKQQIVLSDGQRSSIKQFIRYILAGAEASTRVVAACNNEQATTTAHKNYLWDSRGLLHSLTSLARLANYYLETENDDLKAVLLVLIIINTVGSVAYGAGTYDAHTAYTTEQHTQQTHPLQAQAATRGATASTTQDTRTTKTPTPQTTVSHTATTDKPTHNANLGLGTGAVGQDVLATIATLPNTATAMATDQATTTMATSIGSANATPLPLTASVQGSATAAAATSRFAHATDRATRSLSDEKQGKLEAKQPSPLDAVRAHRPLGTKDPVFNHDDFRTTVLAYQQQPQNRRHTWNHEFGFMIELELFCKNLGIKPFLEPLTDDSEDKNVALIRKHWDTTPLNPNASAQEVEQFCRSFQTFCEREHAKEQQVATLLARLRTRRPSDGKDAAFSHEDFKSALQAYSLLQDHEFWRHGYASNLIGDLDASCTTGNIKPFFATDLKIKELFEQHGEKVPLPEKPSQEAIEQFCQSFQAFCTQAAENEHKGMLPLDEVQRSRPSGVIAQEFNQTDFERMCQALMTACTYDNYEHSLFQRNLQHYWGYPFNDPEHFIDWFNYFCERHGIQFFFKPSNNDRTGLTTYNAKRYNNLFAKHWDALGDANPFCKKPSANADVKTFCQTFATLCADDDKIMQEQETLLEQVRKSRPYREGEPAKIEQAPFNPQDIENALTAFAMECNKTPRKTFYGIGGMMQPFGEFCYDRGISPFMLFNHSLNGELLHAALHTYWDSATNPFRTDAAHDADIKTFCEGFRRHYALIQKQECAIYALVKDVPRNESKTPLDIAGFKKVCEAFKSMCAMSTKSFYTATSFAKDFNNFCTSLDIPAFFTRTDAFSLEEKDEKRDELRQGNTDLLNRFWAFKSIENPFSTNNDGTTTVQTFCDEFETFYLGEQKKAAARAEAKQAAEQKATEEKRLVEQKEAEAQRIREEAEFKEAQEKLLEPLRKSRPLDTKSPDVAINFKELEPALEAFQAYRQQQYDAYRHKQNQDSLARKAANGDSDSSERNPWRLRKQEAFLQAFNTYCNNARIQPFFAGLTNNNADLYIKYVNDKHHGNGLAIHTDEEDIYDFCQEFESFCAQQQTAETDTAKSAEEKESQAPTPATVAPTTAMSTDASHAATVPLTASVLSSGSASATLSSSHAPVATGTGGDGKQSHEVKHSKEAAPVSPLVAIRARRPLGSKSCTYYNNEQFDAAWYADMCIADQEYRREDDAYIRSLSLPDERERSEAINRAFNQFCRRNGIEPFFR